MAHENTYANNVVNERKNIASQSKDEFDIRYYSKNDSADEFIEEIDGVIGKANPATDQDVSVVSEEIAKFLTEHPEMAKAIARMLELLVKGGIDLSGLEQSEKAELFQLLQVLDNKGFVESFISIAEQQLPNSKIAYALKEN